MAFRTPKHSKNSVLSSIDPAKSKIKNSNFHEMAYSEIRDQLNKIQLDPLNLLERKQFGKYKIVSPLFAESENMELLILEKLDNVVVMTFVCKNEDGIVEIPEKGKMLFSVAVGYYKPIDQRLFNRIFRKTANIPLIRDLTGKMGTTGRWVVFDYNYKYNRRDYLDWVLKEANNLSKKHDKEIKKFSAIIKDKESYAKWRAGIIEEADRRLDFLYKWGNIEMKRQIEHIESLYKAQQEAEKDKYETE